MSATTLLAIANAVGIPDLPSQDLQLLAVGPPPLDVAVDHDPRAWYAEDREIQTDWVSSVPGYPDRSTCSFTPAVTAELRVRSSPVHESSGDIPFDDDVVQQGDVHESSGDVPFAPVEADFALQYTLDGALTAEVLGDGDDPDSRCITISADGETLLLDGETVDEAKLAEALAPLVGGLGRGGVTAAVAHLLDRNDHNASIVFARALLRALLGIG